MVNSNRGIKPGTAISRSRFEDNTFTLGDNLKDGVKTKKWGVVQIKDHTEFEIIFNDPSTKELHPGVASTIKNGENLDCWPGYPDYRHIMVGGKGTLIYPPNCDETWGMMCEGDIAEIYDFKGINLKVPATISILTGILFIANGILNKIFPSKEFIFLAISWIIICISSMIISRKLIVSPLSKTIDILQDIAEGEGNLTKRVDKISADEIGELSRWFNKFINSQMTMLKRVKKSAKTTKKSVNIVSRITSELKSGMSQIEKTVVNLLENSQEQNDTFQETKNKFSDISASIQEMDSLILEISNVVHDTNESSQKADGVTKIALNSMEELESLIKKTVDSITNLQEHSKHITNVVNVINDISQQTQLLALNACIEAARAGDSGKGFAVVAAEISKLALETESATKSISGVISDVQKQTQSTYEYAGRMNDKVDMSISSVRESIDSFAKVNEDVNIISTAMQSISEITSTQSQDVSDVMNNVSTMADKINESTELSSNQSERSLETVKRILGHINQLKQATEALEYSAENMDEMVGSFKLS